MTKLKRTEEEEVGEDNFRKAQIEENESKESIKQKIVKDITVKTTSKTSQGIVNWQQESYFCLQVGKEGTAAISKLYSSKAVHI